MTKLKKMDSEMLVQSANGDIYKLTHMKRLNDPDLVQYWGTFFCPLTKQVERACVTELAIKPNKYRKELMKQIINQV